MTATAPDATMLDVAQSTDKYITKEFIKAEEAARRRAQAQAFKFAFDLALIATPTKTAIVSIHRQYPLLDLKTVRSLYRKARNLRAGARMGNRRHA